MELIAGYLFIFAVLSTISCAVALLQKEDNITLLTATATAISWIAFIIIYANIP